MSADQGLQAADMSCHLTLGKGRYKPGKFPHLGGCKMLTLPEDLPLEHVSSHLHSTTMTQQHNCLFEFKDMFSVTCPDLSQPLIVFGGSALGSGHSFVTYARPCCLSKQIFAFLAKPVKQPVVANSDCLSHALAIGDKHAARAAGSHSRGCSRQPTGCNR